MRISIILKHFVDRVLFCAESNQTVIKEINFERVVAGCKHIDSDVVLVAVEEMRLGDVLARDVVLGEQLALWNVGAIIDNADASSVTCLQGPAHPDCILASHSLL